MTDIKGCGIAQTKLQAFYKKKNLFQANTVSLKTGKSLELCMDRNMNVSLKAQKKND